MASEKQIAANRANAKKSTGPKTPAGKFRSSMNAHRHGLSLPLELTSEAVAKATAFVQALTVEAKGETVSDYAAEFAQAQLEIERVQRIREELMATLDLDQPDIATLKRLAALDRWDRYALTKRRRAARKLQRAPVPASSLGEGKTNLPKRTQFENYRNDPS